MAVAIWEGSSTFSSGQTPYDSMILIMSLPRQLITLQIGQLND